MKEGMIRSIRNLISEIHKLSPEQLGETIEVEGITCDDELYDIVDVLNKKSTQIQKYIDHLKYVIGYIQHEFNTPLATLSLSLERIQDTLPDRDVTNIQDEIDHMSDLVNSLSYLSNIHKQKVELTEIDLTETVWKVIGSVQRAYPDASISFVHDNSYLLRSHEMYMHFILKNIIENAVKYSPRWSEVVVEMIEDALVVKDTWVGIAEEDLEHIWMPFWQADGSRGQDSWFGLGLSLVRELTQLLNISVQVISTKGEWTTFILWFSNHVTDLSGRG